MVPQQTPDAELTAPGNTVDPEPSATDGGCTDVFIRVEERSRTDDFVTADPPDEVVIVADCNGDCDL